MPSRQINDFSPKGNRKKLSKWPNLLFDQGVVTGVVEVRNIKVDVSEVPESPMPPTSVDDRDDILGLVFYITTPKYGITSLATSERLCDFETSLAL